MSNNKEPELLTFGGHLDVLRRMLFRIIGITLGLGIAIFYFKDEAFDWLLAPGRWDFVTYRALNRLCQWAGIDFGFSEFHVNLISTELAGQFMTHLSTSVMLALLLASPYIVFELFRFIAPALYEKERKYSMWLVVTIYLLFILGVAMSYYVIFPISFRFLGTYQVADAVTNQITLSSYVSSFVMLTLGMGAVFQIPIIVFFLSRIGILSDTVMRHYRRHAILIIFFLAAVITPSIDIFTLLLVAAPLCLLYEISIGVAARNCKFQK